MRFFFWSSLVVALSVFVEVGSGLAARKVVIGLNKYSHNSAVALIDVDTGELLFATEKERLTRAKNDGGAVGDVVRAALSASGASIADVVGLAQNNHHASIASAESRWADARAAGIASVDEEVFDPANLLPGVKSTEVSHHLAHALAAAWSESPDEDAVILVLDGMGERASRFKKGAVEMHSDANLDGFSSSNCVHALNDVFLDDDFGGVPDDARECESVYSFEKGELRPIFKRWCLSASSSLDYEDWFLAPLDSCGAAYSSASQAVFGDWNACGKLMGLAPWAEPVFTGEEGSSTEWGQKCASWSALARSASLVLDSREEEVPRLLEGAVWGGCEGSSLKVNRGAIGAILAAAAAAMGRPETQFPRANVWRAADGDVQRACCAVLARRVQRELEEAVLPMVKRANNNAGGDSKKRLIICGGVALNSVLNGKIEAGVCTEELRVPCAPGDESVALGCAVHALSLATTKKPDMSLLPYSGCVHEAWEVAAAADEFAEWLLPIEVEDATEHCAAVVASGRGVVFWFDGRSEFGPRALGHRSIVASATAPKIVDQINSIVKQREDFRPLAPSLLVECAAGTFLDVVDEETPYMSRVWTVATPEDLPGCSHVDGSARPQTVGAKPARYRALIEAVQRLTGKGVVLNTSFNTKPSEPIVESPRGAVSSFLEASMRNSDATDPLQSMVLALGSTSGIALYSPRDCPIVDGDLASAAHPIRRHGRWTVRRECSPFDDSAQLFVCDLDEDFEDSARTGRGNYVFSSELEAAVYERADGDTSADDLATELEVELGVSTVGVYLCLADLWRATLIRLD